MKKVLVGFSCGLVLAAAIVGARVRNADDARPRRAISAILSGPPAIEFCSDDERDAGRAAISISDGTLWICAGEAKGWLAK